MKYISRSVFIFPLLMSLWCSRAFASEKSSAVVDFINFYALALHSIGFSEEDVHSLEPVAGSLFCFLIILTIGLFYRRSFRKNEEVFPEEKISLRFFIEIMIDVPYGLAKDFCGKDFKSFLALLCGLFVFILVSNLSGLIPGFPPPTENMNTNLAMGISVFLVYNYAGIKEHKIKYIKQFMGPILLMAPLFFVIEIFSHLARPFSLSLRLMGNIFGDHLILTVFTGLTYIIFPGLLLFFGLLVACVQSFVFTLLSGVYISMAISHDH